MGRLVKEKERRARAVVRRPDHPFSGKGGLIPRARLIVEDAMGKYLKPQHLVHHVDGDFTNDVNSNLVVCEDSVYHKLIHERTDALKNHGNPEAKQCTLCKFWALPEFLVDYARGKAHRECINSFQQDRASGLVVTRQEWREHHLAAEESDGQPESG